MTTAELAAYYANLLIIQYRQKAKAYATIKTLCGLMIMEQVAFAVRDAFSIDTAVGAQLDLIGAVIGASRTALTYSGAVSLSDNDYRSMIKMKVVKNNADSSLYDIQVLLKKFFPGAIRVFDNSNMSISYQYNALLGSSQLAEAFVRQDILPKPMGVQMASLTYVAALTNVFGFRTYSLPNTEGHGFNTYGTYDLDAPWLSYANVLGG